LQKKKVNCAEKNPDEVESEALIALGHSDKKPVMPPSIWDYCFGEIGEGKLG
jgi:hypothetical protein